MAVLREIEAVRKNLGLWRRSDHTVLRFLGADAGSWLQAQTTNDLSRLETGQGNLNALLDRRGRLQAAFSVYRFEDEYWLVIEKNQVAAVEARIESHLFLEDVTMENVGADTDQLCVEGPRALVFLGSLLDEEAPASTVFPDREFSFAPVSLAGHDVLAFRVTDSGEDGYLLVPAPGEADTLYETLFDRGHEYNLCTVSEQARRTLEIESGRPRFGREIPPETVIAETPLEAEAVSYDKGCYLGQEVVARLKTYGTPKQYLMGLLVEDDATLLPESGMSLFAGGKRVGQMRASAYGPTVERLLAVAFLDRQHRTPDSVVHLAGAPTGKPFAATVTPLPAYQPPSRRAFAETLYEEALQHFEADPEDTDETAIDMLAEAIILAPDFEDAYEVLGVILHRHHRVDEAIDYMKRLERLNPSSVMAHTNLSVFYVAKGMIQEAENEKAKAEQLEFKQQLDAKQAEKAAAEERERITREAEQRIDMFKEVLEIDPEDSVATMGLGSAYIQLERYADAIPPLETAVQTQKDFSAAYLNLGKCHEFLGHTEQAAEVYRQGIEAAGRKGDLMPMNEMKRRLQALEAPETSPAS